MDLEQKVTELEKRVADLEKATAATVTISLDGKKLACQTSELISHFRNREARRQPSE